MSGHEGQSGADDRLKFLAETAGIPVLRQFEHDSGKLEAKQNDVREKLSLVEDGQRLLDTDEPTDDLSDDQLRFHATVH